MSLNHVLCLREYYFLVALTTSLSFPRYKLVVVELQTSECCSSHRPMYCPRRIYTRAVPQSRYAGQLAPLLAEYDCGKCIH